MRNRVPAPARGQASRRFDVPGPSDRLRELARKVERLGVSGRTDPESIVLGKLSIAGELRRLARELGP